MFSLGNIALACALIWIGLIFAMQAAIHPKPKNAVEVFSVFADIVISTAFLTCAGLLVSITHGRLLDCSVIKWRLLGILEASLTISSGSPGVFVIYPWAPLTPLLLLPFVVLVARHKAHV